MFIFSDILVFCLFLRRQVTLHKNLQTASDAVERSKSEKLDVVPLLPAARCQDIDEDEDEILDNDQIPNEVSDEAEVHEEVEEEDASEESEHEEIRRWKKNARLLLQTNCMPQNLGKAYFGKESNEIFNQLFSPEIIQYETEQKIYLPLQTKMHKNFMSLRKKK